MNGMLSRFFALLILFFVVGNAAYGQVDPAEINHKLLKESMNEVLGSYRNLEWTTLSLSGLVKEDLDLKQINKLPDSLYIGSVETDEGTRWIIPDSAPSRSETFSFVLYLTSEKNILDVDVLEYRENYGYEIDYPFFRAQFRGKQDPGEIRFGRTVQNISGATISARSLTYAVHDLLSILKSIDLKR